MKKIHMILLSIVLTFVATYSSISFFSTNALSCAPYQVQCHRFISGGNCQNSCQWFWCGEGYNTGACPTNASIKKNSDKIKMALGEIEKPKTLGELLVPRYTEVSFSNL